MSFAIIGIFFILIILGFPIGFSLGIVPIGAFLLFDMTALTTPVQKMFTGLDSFALLAVPLFILAGDLMSTTNMSGKLIDFANMFVRRIRGGLGMATVISSTLFGGVSGSANADTAAIGSITIPGMINTGYSRGFATALQACSGTIGSLIPPSILSIMFGVAASCSISKMFMGGIIPGVLMCLAYMTYCFIYASREGKGKIIPYELPAGKTKLQLINGALPALLLIVILVGGIRLGIVTPTEGAAVAVVYAVLVGKFVYKTLTWKKFYKSLIDSAITSGSVLMILANAYILSYLLTIEGLPTIIRGFLTQFHANPILVLVFINILLLIVGTFLEGIAAIILLTPVLLPMAEYCGLSPVGFGIIMVTALVIGMFTPPVGVTLFVSCGISGAKIPEAMRNLIPLFFFSVAVLALVNIFNPQICAFVDLICQ